MSNSIIKKILIAVSAVGPGLFLIGYNIGTGSVTTMAKAGAEYGMTLLWAVVLSCIFTYILMAAYGQVTLVSGKTALLNIKSQFKWGKPLALYIMAALITGELLALVGIMGIVADLIQEGLRLMTDGAMVSVAWIVPVLIIALFSMFWFGQYKIFEKVLTVFVIMMVFCFVGVFFMISPDLLSIVQGLVPSMPDEPGAFGLVAAMAGTTCSAAVFIIRSTVVTEKGWTIDNLKDEKKDAFVSSAMMLLLSGLIMAVSAGTLHLMGLKVDNTLDLIGLFEPIGGKVASLMLILGIAGAGLSTIFPIVLIAPWLISDYMGKPRDIQSPMYRVLIILGLLVAFCAIFLEKSPTILMVFSMAFQAAILPAVAIPVFLLLNKKSFMNDYTASSRMNAGLIAVILFSLVTTYFAIRGFF
ncbi:MAG: Nramp family divalent metal transporter [Alphaproteobacteria bacterium]|nr:Nramp family divalent metal transporter [Alphaproteobacteria bacterium]HPF46556.1 Nramp family divalent metal transporter [Emcibacteraceae bacterium]